MRLTCVVLLGVIVSSTGGSWIGDITSPRGLSFGDGVSLKVEDTKAKNSSVLERLALRVDNENVGITMAQNEKKKAVELDFYVKDRVEGRGKKMGNVVIPLAMSAMGSGAMAIALAGIKMIVMKALMIAKMALMISVMLVLGKLMKEKDSGPRYVEVEHHAASEVYPVYTEYPHSGSGNSYAPSGGGGGYANYGGYSYGPSAAESSVVNYAAVEAPGGNGSAAPLSVAQQLIPAGRRRDHRRRSRPMILTITHITEPEKDGLL